jgi:hypothetical protein
MKRILFVLITTVLTFTAEAQINELGVFAGGANYIGDVGPTDYIAPNGLALGIIYKWNRSPRHSWRASFTYGNLSSHDADSDVPSRKQRGFEFENNVKELSAGMEFNFFDFNLHEDHFKITPYVYSGLSYAWFNELYIDSDGVGKEDGNNSSLAIPMTVGIKAHIAAKWVIGVEVGARYTFNDNIDGSNPDNGQRMHFGNLESNDWYVFSGVTLTYTFGEKPCYCN